MFGFGKKRLADNSPGGLGWDLHAHLLPGVDDGARTNEESLASIRALKALGYEGCIVTPHVYKDLYENNRAHLEQVFTALKAHLVENNVRFGLYLAAEYFGDAHLIELAEAKELLGFGPKSQLHVLVEFPYISEPLYWADVLSALLRNGYQPVIAHPERYRYLAANPSLWLERFGHYQVKYQYELGSLVGQYGKEAIKAVRFLVERQLSHFWGTDLHRASQAERFIRPSLDKIATTRPLNAELEPLFRESSVTVSPGRGDSSG